MVKLVDLLYANMMRISNQHNESSETSLSQILLITLLYLRKQLEKY